MKILVVDDNEGARDFVTVALQRTGHEVLAACNGNEALAVAAETAIDLVISDVLMPECDGIELLRALRKLRPSLPVIAISGGSPNFDIDFLRLARTLGAVATISKPFMPADLEAAIATVRGGA